MAERCGKNTECKLFSLECVEAPEDGVMGMQLTVNFPIELGTSSYSNIAFSIIATSLLEKMIPQFKEYPEILEKLARLLEVIAQDCIFQVYTLPSKCNIGISPKTGYENPLYIKILFYKNNEKNIVICITDNISIEFNERTPAPWLKSDKAPGYVWEVRALCRNKKESIISDDVHIEHGKQKSIVFTVLKTVLKDFYPKLALDSGLQYLTTRMMPQENGALKGCLSYKFDTIQKRSLQH